MVERLNNGTQYEYYHNYTNMMLYPTDKCNDTGQLKIIVSIGVTRRLYNISIPHTLTADINVQENNNGS